MAVPAIVALGAALVIAVRRDHCSERLLDWLTPLATALTSVVVASAGPASVPAYATLYSLIVVCSAWFQRPRLIVANLVFIAAAYAGVLAVTHDAGSAQIDWLLAITALALLALVIVGLRSRADRLVDGLRLQSAQREKISALMERVLDGAEVSVVMDACATRSPRVCGSRARRSSRRPRASCAFRACSGWPIGTIGGVFKLPEGALSLQAPVPGHDNVLVALAQPPHRFTRADGDLHRRRRGRRRLGAGPRQRRRRAAPPRLLRPPDRAAEPRADDRAPRARPERAGSTPGQIAVLQLDIDNFRVVNDSLGYQAGDALLSAIPGRVRPQLALTDTSPASAATSW